VSFESNRLVRALQLFWLVLGPARIYVAATLALIFVLAAIGVRHLIAPPSQPAVSIAAASPSPTPSKAIAGASPRIQSSSPSAFSPTTAPPEAERAIAITDVTEAERRGPRGEMFIVATIGMTSRTTADKDNIEIRVLFFDVDRNNEMHPTDAQVTYQWLTPIRDWTDPAPKYLAATYFQRRPFRRPFEQLRYGGFVVRVYCDGKLQDERSKPETLLAALHRNAPPPIPSDRPPVPPSVTPQPFQSIPPSIAPTPLAQKTASPPSTAAPSSPSAIVNPPSSPPSSPQTSEEPLPKGIPIPGKPGFVQSPYDPKFIIDVRGFPPGTLVNDPNTNKPFRVP
jgi:hypothetical protein